MKEYDDEKYVLVPRKAASFHKWCAYFTGMLGELALWAAIAMVFLWAIIQVLLMFKAVI